MASPALGLTLHPTGQPDPAKARGSGITEHESAPSHSPALSSRVPLNPDRYHSPDRRLYPDLRPPRAELNWVHVIHAEIVSVTATMRKNQRWSINSDREMVKDDSGTPPYNHWQDVALHGRTGLNAVIEFSRGMGDKGIQGGVVLLRDLDPMDLLEPFLEVIRSGDTTGPITGAALSSVEKFIIYKVLDPLHPGLPAAMSALTHSVTRCKFEASDAVSDEGVLSRILRLLRVTVTSEVGQRNIDDKGICEMVEVAFGMFFQGRVSELLRKSAEETLIVLVQALFERLTIVIRTKEHEALLRESASTTSRRNSIPKSDEGVVDITQRRLSAAARALSDGPSEPRGDGGQPPPQISVGTGGSSGQGAHDGGMISVGMPASPTAGSEAGNAEDGVRIGFTSNEGIVPDGVVKTVRHEEPRTEESSPMHEEVPTEAKSGGDGVGDGTSQSVEQAVPAVQPQTRPFQPYGLPAILEMLRVLTTLIDPRNRNHTDSMHRTVALKLLQTAVEVGGRSLGRWVAWGFEVDSERRRRQTGDSLRVRKDKSGDVKIATDASGGGDGVGAGPVDVKSREAASSANGAAPSDAAESMTSGPGTPRESTPSVAPEVEEEDTTLTEEE
ncbi:GDP/GTP exchange factor for ARF, partial [Borealophlyctis nickersoniae]